mgnify:CR=1 FL=1|jgi:hypothetical protein
MGGNFMAKMSKKKKYMAYILHEDDEFGYKQKKIAELMGVSQSTISSAVKEMRYEAEIYGLKKELEEKVREKARALIAENVKYLE